MIEPTDEMLDAYVDAADPWDDTDGQARARIAAVLAIVGRDRCMEPRGHVWHPLDMTPPTPAGAVRQQPLGHALRPARRPPGQPPAHREQVVGMIEPTNEMGEALLRALPDEPHWGWKAEDAKAWLVDVLAIVERDRFANPAAIRRALDEAVNAAEPIAGGPLLPPLRLLKQTLDHFPAKATP